MSDSEDTTFEYGQQHAEDKYVVKLDEDARKRLQRIYRAGPKTSVTLVANSAAYESDNLRYKQLMKTRFVCGSRKSPFNAAKMNDSELKLLYERYMKDDVFVKKEAMDEYLDTYYDRIHAPGANETPHVEHLKLMYQKLFPPSEESKGEDPEREFKQSESSDDAEEEPGVLLTELRPGTANAQKASLRETLRGIAYGEQQQLHDVKKYIKRKVKTRETGQKQEIYLDMLKRVGYMTLEGKEVTAELQATASGLKKIKSKLDFRLREAAQKSVNIVAKTEDCQAKLEELNRPPRMAQQTNNAFRPQQPSKGRTSIRSMSLMDASAFAVATSTKKETLAEIRRRLSALTKPATAAAIVEKRKESARKPSARSMHKSSSYCANTKTPSTGWLSDLRLSKYRDQIQLKELSQQIDPARLIVRRTGTYRAQPPPRVIDYSLSIGSPVSSSGATTARQAISANGKRSAHRPTLSVCVMSPQSCRPGTAVRPVYSTLSGRKLRKSEADQKP